VSTGRTPRPSSSEKGDAGRPDRGYNELEERHMLRIVLVGVLIFAALVAVKDGRLLKRAHIVGVCEVYAQTGDGAWHACYPGRLTGRPSLQGNGCTDRGLRGDAEVWHCPAPLAGNTVRQ
jgi:hypothetical protein